MLTNHSSNHHSSNLAVGALHPILLVDPDRDLRDTRRLLLAARGNVNIPIFNGFRFTAQASEAALQAQAASEQTRALREQVARDVRTAWLNANTALQRVTVTSELVQEANTALDLAKTRYDLGLSSIVELSQAELQQTEAAISNANAKSQYNFAISTINFQTGVQP